MNATNVEGELARHQVIWLLRNVPQRFQCRWLTAKAIVKEALCGEIKALKVHVHAAVPLQQTYELLQ